MKKYIVLLILFTGFAACKKNKIETNNEISANDFLSSAKYDKLIVEVQYVTGFKPEDAAIENLKAFLQQRLNKPSGISVILTSITSPGKISYSADNIREIEKSNRTQHTSAKTLTAYILYVDADYSENSGNSKVLGIAYANSSMSIFKKTINEFSGGLTQPSTQTLESIVLKHELGHVIGLVNNGTPVQTSHQDVPHGKHCNNQNCLMYYTAETSEIVANILGGNVPELDANCISDLRANGGK